MSSDQESKSNGPGESKKGLDVGHFMIAIAVAIVVILVGALVFLRGEKTKAIPHANSPQPTTATPPQP